MNRVMTRSPATLVFVAVSMLALAGCAGTATRGAPTPALVCDATAGGATTPACAEAIAMVTTRAAAEATREAMGEGWTMQGRAAISTGQQSGNARVTWRQSAGDRYTVELAAPITRQTWLLTVGPGSTVIEGLPEGPRSGRSPSLLLREVTGWDIPVESLRYWLRGLPSSVDTPQRHAFAADGALVGLLQDGWQIEFVRADAGALPSRINAQRGDSRVRLVIDQWARDARE